MNEFNQHLEKLLLDTGKYNDENGDLIKTKVITLAQRYDNELLSLLMSDVQCKGKFFTDISGHTVFKQSEFIYFIQEKNFLSNSFTQYKNKIGLSMGRDKMLKYHDEVVLNFPFKDCVLEGGQTKDDDKRKETYFNEVLASDEIDRLYDRKALVGFKRYDKDGEHAFDAQFNRDESGTIKDNLIVKGNNLLALHSLKSEFGGKVKLIYIDPPYNTGNDSFGYNDNFNHSTWLVFMKNRLQVAKDMLRDDGSIWVSIDSDELAYIKVLMDEIFGRDNFVHDIVWQKKRYPQNDARYFSDTHEYLLVYSKDKINWKRNLIKRSDEQEAMYKNPDNDSRGVWRTQPLTVKTFEEKNVFPITAPGGEKYMPTEGLSWRVNETRYKELLADNRIWFGQNRNGRPLMKKFRNEVQEGVVPITLWLGDEVGDNKIAAYEIRKLFDDRAFMTPKPEKLLEKVIHIATQPGDIVLDYHLGSGTTTAVAHKMGRQYIGIEQMDYIHSVTLERMKKVIGTLSVEKSIDGTPFYQNYDTGGISKNVNWTGGGSLVYFELAKYNQHFIELIEQAKSTDDLLNVWKHMKDKAFFLYNVDMKELQQSMDNGTFSTLPHKEQQKNLIEILNTTQLYLPATEMEDVDHKLTKEDIDATRGFYGK